MYLVFTKAKIIDEKGNEEVHILVRKDREKNCVINQIYVQDIMLIID